MRKGLHINVGDLLRPGADAEKTVPIDFTLQEQDPEIKILRPVVGSVRLIPATNGVVGYFQLETNLELACSIDSEAFQYPLHLSFQHEFGGGGADSLSSPIGSDHSVDLAPVIRDEIIVSIPMKPLCPKHQE